MQEDLSMRMLRQTLQEKEKRKFALTPVEAVAA